jgi:diacylglycerol kinase family enzyme
MGREPRREASLRIAVVINGSAGSLVGRETAAEEVAAHLRAAGYDVLIEHDDGRGLIERIRDARRREADAVVVGGGDGTIACAAQHLVGTGVTLGILPLGTMNLLAKDLGVPTALPEAVDALARGVVREIDVGEVNGRVFLINSVLGMPARLARHREARRGAMRLHDVWRMVVGAFRELYRYPPLTVGLEVGRRRRRLRTRAVAVVDNDYDEGFGRIFTRSRLDGGRLTLYVTRGLTGWSLLKLAFRMAMGSWRAAAELERFEGERFVISARRKRLRVMNDGEVLLLKPPLRYRIRPKALRVLVPAATAAKADPPALPEAATGAAA